MNHVLEDKITQNTGSNNFLNVIFDSCNNFQQFNLKLFVRCVDNTLVAFENKNDAITVLGYLKNLHSNLRFTMEEETDNSIPFLDLLIIRDTKHDIIETTVYHKPTHSGMFTNYTSFIPHYFKVALVKTLVTRAYWLCSNWHLFASEIDKIKELLMHNGYNKTFLENIIGTQLDRFITDDTYRKHGPEQCRFFMRIPFLGDPSNRLLGPINACLNQFKLGSIKVELLHSFSRLEGTLDLRTSNLNIY